MSTLLIIIILLLFIIYNGYTIYRFGIPESLSVTAYLFKSKLYFTMYCIITAFCITPLLFEITPENYSALAFFIPAGLALAAMSAEYKQGLDKYIHYISAIFSAVAFLLYLFIVMHNEDLIYSFIFFLLSLIFYKPKSYVYFFEMLSLLYIMIYIIKLI